jgi:hypothetical protein
MSATFPFNTSGDFDWNAEIATKPAVQAHAAAEPNPQGKTPGKVPDRDVADMLLDEVIRDTCHRVRAVESTQGSILITLENFRANGLNGLTMLAAAQQRTTYLIGMLGLIFSLAMGSTWLWLMAQ